jgi:predicted Zn-dependent protease
MGHLVSGEAQYQIHILYLWYEEKWREALAIVRNLQNRYPRNPLLRQIEAEILDVYMHDAAASLKASEELLAMATAGSVNRPDLAATVARLNIAKQLIALKQPQRAADILDRVIADQPLAPHGAIERARALRRALK